MTKKKVGRVKYPRQRRNKTYVSGKEEGGEEWKGQWKWNKKNVTSIV